MQHRLTPALVLGGALILAQGCSPRPVSLRTLSTSGDRSLLLSPALVEDGFSRPAKQGEVGITIDPHQTFQPVEGFGASLTDAAAWSLGQLSPEDRHAILLRLFDPVQGLGLNLLRQPMGSPDFARSTYSYLDLPPGETDPDLKAFSLGRDLEYIVPILKEILSINPQVRLMASPWSPPAWMKSGQSMIGAEGGHLLPEYYPAYARYFVKYIEAMAEHGITISAVTMQNEIRYAPAQYAGMLVDPREEARFVGEHLGPALEAAGLKVDIFCYDHNWDGEANPTITLSDPKASKYLSGSAWHWYGGEAEAMSRIQRRFPQKAVWFTEGSTGTWIGGGTFPATLHHGALMGVDIFNNWSQTLILWNLALDENNGPIVFPNTANYGLVQVDTQEGRVVEPHRASFYLLGHFSPQVRRGALRILADDTSGKASATAFRNPDGSIVVVVANRLKASSTTTIIWEGRAQELVLPPSGLVTLVWQP